MKKFLVSLIIGLILAGTAWAIWDDTLQNDQVWWGFGQRSALYSKVPREMTALELWPHPTHPPVHGTRAELTLHRRPWTEPLEFFNLMVADGHQYDAMQQNDHQVRFSMEVGPGGTKIPMFFCWEVYPAGAPAYCPLRIYPKESAHRGVWICREEGDCIKLGG